MANLSTLTISGSNQYINITDHASAPSPTANKLYANSTSLYWEDTDLAAGGGDAMDKVKSQGPSTSGSLTTTGLANTSVRMASGANTAVNILFNQGTTIAGAYNAIIHVGGDVNMPGLAITSDGTDGSQTFNDLSLTDHSITATGHVHHDSGGSVSLRMAGAGFGSGTDTAYNDTAIYFDGSGDGLTLTDHEDWDTMALGITGWTFEAWIYVADVTDRHTLFQQYVDSDNYFQLVVGTSGKIDLYSLSGGAYIMGNKNGYNAGVGKTLVNNAWNHVAAVRDGNEWLVYTNGVPAPEGPEPQYGFATFAANPIIGKGASASTWDTTGYMDNIRIYPYAKYTEDFSKQLPILARAITSNRAGEFTVRGNALYVGAGDDVSLADTGFVNRTGENTTGDGLISVVIDSPQTVNSTAFMVPVIFKNTSDVQLTLNYNMWASVRANTATGSAATSRMTHYGARGLWFGGGAPTLSDTIDYNTIATSAEAVDFGNLTTATRNLSAASGGSRAVVGGGTQSPGAVDVIEFVTVASTGEATDFGNLAAACRDLTALADGNRGCFAGGDRPSTSNVIDFITISVAGNASDFGDMGVVRSHLGSCSNGSRGIVVSDYPPQSHTFDIEYFAIGTLGNTLDFGSTIEDKPLWGDMATDDGSRGVFMGGGTTPPNSDTIDYINMGSIGNSADFGNLNTGRGRGGACSDGTTGLLGGGSSSPPTVYYDSKDLITIGTLGNASDFNELSQARHELASTSGD